MTLAKLVATRTSGPSFHDASHRTYRLFYSVVFFAMAVRCALCPLGRIAQVADLLVTRPVGPWNVLPLLTSSAAAELLRWVACGACLAAALRVRPAVTATAAAVLVTLQAAFLRGMGHVNHTEMGAITVLLALTLATWTDAIDGESAFISDRRAGHAFFTAGLMFSLTYVMAFMVRVVNGGPSMFTSHSIKYWAMRNAMIDSAVNNTVRGVSWELVHDGVTAWLLEVGFPMVSIFEALAPLFLVHRGFRRLFLATMLAFHLLSALVLGVIFTDSIVILVFYAIADALWLPRDVRDATPTADGIPS